MISNTIIRWLNGALLCGLYCVAYSVNTLANDVNGLDKLSIEELMGSKVVTATRSEQQLVDTASAAYVISQDDIRRSGATTIPEALRMVPGLHVARISASKWAISARGFNGLIAEKILVLMDGRSLYSPINNGVFWEIQDRVLDDIERIEVIRGPGASVWGANAVNGVINIITKHSADTKEGTAALFAGDKYGASLRKGWQFANQGYARVYGKFLRDESFVNSLGNNAGEEWTSGRGGFRLDWANANGKHAFMAQGDVYYGIYNENVAKTDPLLGLTNAFLLNRVEKKGGNILARWNYNPSLASRMTTQFFYDKYQQNQTRDISIGSEQFDFDFQHVFALNEAHELTWGLNYRLSLVRLNPFNDSAVKSLFTEYFPKTFENHRFSVFVQDKWRWGDTVEITFGSKFEHHNNNNFEYEPSLRVLWKVANQHRLWAGISRAVRLPAVTDLLADRSEENSPLNSREIFRFKQYENFRSDVVVSYELGYRYWHSDLFSLDVAAYFNQYNNHVDANSQFTNFAPSDQSLKKSTTVGLETALVWRPLDWVRFQLSASFMDRDIQAKQEDPSVILENNSQDPRFLVALRSSFDITSSVGLDFWLRYVDPATAPYKITDVFNPARPRLIIIPSYLTLDARLAWRPNKNLELAFIANNLNDSYHPEFYEGLAPNLLQVERQFWLQANLKF